MSDPDVEIEVVVVRETERAWGIEDADNPRNIIWLPKSKCRLEGKMLTAPEWLLKDRGLV